MKTCPPSQTTHVGSNQAGIYDQFCEAVKDAVNKFKLGDGLVDGTTLGPLISPAAVDRVRKQFRDISGFK